MEVWYQNGLKEVQVVKLQPKRQEFPPPYDQVVGPGPAILYYGSTDVWGVGVVDLDWKVDYYILSLMLWLIF